MFVTYTPRTVLAPGAPWPGKSDLVWDVEPVDDPLPIGKDSQKLLKVLTKTPWLTAYQCAVAVRREPKAVRAVLMHFCATGRVIAKYVPGVKRGVALGFAVNPRARK